MQTLYDVLVLPSTSLRCGTPARTLNPNPENPKPQTLGFRACKLPHGLHSSSFSGIDYRVLNMKPKKEGLFRAAAQRLQYPLIKECTLSYSRTPNMI